jgi:hypothetical protein
MGRSSANRQCLANPSPHGRFDADEHYLLVVLGTKSRGEPHLGIGMIKPPSGFPTAGYPRTGAGIQQHPLVIRGTAPASERGVVLVCTRYGSGRVRLSAVGGR